MTYRKREGVEFRSATVSAYQGFNEMIKFIEANPGVNYYDVLAHAYDNDKDLWLFSLSKDAKSINKYIKSKMIKENLKFSNSRYKSYIACRKSRRVYYARHYGEFVE